jgi:hypothetical protein
LNPGGQRRLPRRPESARSDARDGPEQGRRIACDYRRGTAAVSRDNATINRIREPENLSVAAIFCKKKDPKRFQRNCASSWLKAAEKKQMRQGDCRDAGRQAVLDPVSLAGTGW